MTVWVSDDDNKIPIRVKAKIMVGSVKVDITTYSGLKNEFKALVKKWSIDGEAGAFLGIF